MTETQGKDVEKTFDKMSNKGQLFEYNMQKGREMKNSEPKTMNQSSSGSSGMKCTNEACSCGSNCTCEGGNCKCGSSLTQTKSCGNANCPCGDNCSCGETCKCGAASR